MKTFRTDQTTRIRDAIGRINRRPETPATSRARDKVTALAQRNVDDIRSAKRSRVEAVKARELREQARLCARANLHPDRADYQTAAAAYSEDISRRYFGGDDSSITTLPQRPTWGGVDALIRSEWKKIQSRKKFAIRA